MSAGELLVMKFVRFGRKVVTFRREKVCLVIFFQWTRICDHCELCCCCC